MSARAFGLRAGAWALTLLITWVFVVSAAPAAAGRPGTGARARLERALRTTRDVRATIRQERTSPGLGSAPPASGLFEYRKPRQARLEYRSKPPSVLYLNGDTVWVYDPIQKSVLKLAAGPAGAQPLVLFEDSMAALEAAYRIEETGALSVKLEPRDRGRSPWRRVLLRLDRASGYPRRFEIEEEDGGRIVLELTRLRLNAGVPAARLRPAFPPGTQVVGL